MASFSAEGPLSNFQFLSLTSDTAVNILVYVFWCPCICIFLFRVYLGVKMPDHQYPHVWF